MGDDEEATIGPAQGIHAIGNDAQGIDIEPRIRFIENAELRVEQGHLQHFHALLLAAGKADIESTAQHVLCDASCPARARTIFMNSGVGNSFSPRCLRCAFIAAFKKVMEFTPGISTGY